MRDLHNSRSKALLAEELKGRLPRNSVRIIHPTLRAMLSTPVYYLSWRTRKRLIRMVKRAGLEPATR